MDSKFDYGSGRRAVLVSMTEECEAHGSQLDRIACTASERQECYYDPHTERYTECDGHFHCTCPREEP